MANNNEKETFSAARKWAPYVTPAASCPETSCHRRRPALESPPAARPHASQHAIWTSAEEEQPLGPTSVEAASSSGNQFPFPAGSCPHSRLRPSTSRPQAMFSAGRASASGSSLGSGLDLDEEHFEATSEWSPNWRLEMPQPCFSRPSSEAGAENAEYQFEALPTRSSTTQYPDAQANPSTTTLASPSATSRVQTQIWVASSSTRKSAADEDFATVSRPRDRFRFWSRPARDQSAGSASWGQLSAAAGEETIACPIAGCNDKFSACNLLAHVLVEHLSRGKQDLGYAHDSETCVFSFEPRQLRPCRTVCLGVVLFCGKKRVEEAPLWVPLERNASPLQEFREYLPVLVLGKHTFEDEDEDQEAELKSGRVPPPQGSYFIWAQSAAGSRPLYATITALNRDLTQSRSCIRRVATGSDAAPTVDGMEKPRRSNSLHLTEMDMQALKGESRRKEIRLQMIIHEQPTVSKTGASYLGSD
ncbi:uncharacterized protein DMAD_00417 [Drosophila madeirensis]|uniref:DUF4729 domain-containing protein n=1 Tax=Drosophila madeirensis TaxID=30013 RepID=A0AAU9FX82_DROMD